MNELTTYWDIQAVTINNQSGYGLTLGNTGPLEHGEWDQWPVGAIANNATVEAFAARSVNASEVGPGPGTVTYQLPDGATLNFTFDMIFAVAQQSYVTVAVGGATASRYKVEFTTCSQDGWHGQGKRFNATIVLSVNPSGPTSATCVKSHDD